MANGGLCGDSEVHGCLPSNGLPGQIKPPRSIPGTPSHCQRQIHMHLIVFFWTSKPEASSTFLLLGTYLGNRRFQNPGIDKSGLTPPPFGGELYLFWGNVNIFGGLMITFEGVFSHFGWRDSKNAPLLWMNATMLLKQKHKKEQTDRRNNSMRLNVYVEWKPKRLYESHLGSR